MVQRKWTKNDENFNNLKKANSQWVRRFKDLDLIISTKLVDFGNSANQYNNLDLIISTKLVDNTVVSKSQTNLDLIISTKLVDF